MNEDYINLPILQVLNLFPGVEFTSRHGSPDSEQEATWTLSNGYQNELVQLATRVFHVSHVENGNNGATHEADEVHNSDDVDDNDDGDNPAIQEVNGVPNHDNEDNNGNDENLLWQCLDDGFRALENENSHGLFRFFAPL